METVLPHLANKNKTVKTTISDLPVVKIIQKALHQKFPMTCYTKWKTWWAFQQILVILKLEQRIHSRGSQIVPNL